jgi:hypothetical protein
MTHPPVQTYAILPTMTLGTREKSTMASMSKEKRVRFSDNTDQPAAYPNPKEYKFLGAGDNATKSGANGKESVLVEKNTSQPDDFQAFHHWEAADDDDAAVSYKMIDSDEEETESEDFYTSNTHDNETNKKLLQKQSMKNNNNNNNKTYTPTASKTLSFASGTGTKGLFIYRPPRKFAPKVQTTKDARKYEATFYTITLSEVEVFWRKAVAPTVDSLKKLTDHIFSKDRGARILAFSDDSAEPHIKTSLPFEKSNGVLTKFLSKVFLKEGFRPTARIRIAHDVEPGVLETEDGSKFSVTLDAIQEREKVCIGFLVGSMPHATNYKDMREAHAGHPTLQSIRMTLSSEPIKLTSGKSPIDWNQQVKAVHIWVGKSQAMIARAKYNEVFGSRNTGGYPQGVKMRFALAINDPSYPVPASMQMITIRMMSKQKLFLDSLKTEETTTIEAKDASSQWARDDELSSVVARIAMIPLDEDDGMDIGSELRREIFQSHLTTNGTSYNNAKAYGDGLQKKKIRMTKKWSDSQQRYIDSLRKTNTGLRWTASVIQKALDIAWDRWEQRNEVRLRRLIIYCAFGA